VLTGVLTDGLLAWCMIPRHLDTQHDSYEHWLSGLLVGAIVAALSHGVLLPNLLWPRRLSAFAEVRKIVSLVVRAAAAIVVLPLLVVLSFLACGMLLVSLADFIDVIVASTGSQSKISDILRPSLDRRYLLLPLYTSAGLVLGLIYDRIFQPRPSGRVMPYQPFTRRSLANIFSSAIAAAVLSAPLAFPSFLYRLNFLNFSVQVLIIVALLPNLTFAARDWAHEHSASA
jgi:hypothetical protein